MRIIKENMENGINDKKQDNNKINVEPNKNSDDELDDGSDNELENEHDEMDDDNDVEDRELDREDKIEYSGDDKDDDNDDDNMDDNSIYRKGINNFSNQNKEKKKDEEKQIELQGGIYDIDNDEIMGLKYKIDKGLHNNDELFRDVNLDNYKKKGICLDDCDRYNDIDLNKVKEINYSYDKIYNEKKIPTSNNPFINTYITEFNNDEDPLPHNINDEEINRDKNIKFNDNLFRNIDDLWEIKNSQRQFYTVPNIRVPNLQKEFANWLYKIPENCKTNQHGCLRYEDLRFKR